MDIPAGQFKAKCLQIMDQVARSRQPVTITKRGKPVAKIVPADEAAELEPLFGYMAARCLPLMMKRSSPARPRFRPPKPCHYRVDDC